MIDHEFTRPVRFAGGRSLSHVCTGRTQPRNDVWEPHTNPDQTNHVLMAFCWSCLTLFVHEASREAYLAWTAGSWGASVDRQRQDTFLKLADLDRTRPDADIARLEKVDAGGPEPRRVTLADLVAIVGDAPPSGRVSLPAGLWGRFVSLVSRWEIVPATATEPASFWFFGRKVHQHAEGQEPQVPESRSISTAQDER